MSPAPDAEPVAEVPYRSVRPGLLHTTYVRDAYEVTPRMRRLTLTGDGLADFTDNGTDQHVALYFYEPGVVLPRPFTTEAARALLPVARPRLRRYTIRAHRPQEREVDIDFVLHEGDALAAGWAARARPGDECLWFGPSPAWPLPEGAPWLFLLGDETALPAIAATLARLPSGARVRAVIEVADAEEEQPLPTRADADVVWLHRGARTAGQALHEAVTATPLPPGEGHVWGAAERGVVRGLRDHFTRTHRMGRARARLTPYWTRGTPQDE